MTIVIAKLLDSHEPYDVKAANASLIAAAPELLAALRETIDVTTVYHRNDPVGRPWLMNALAAIAKAEGR